MDETTLLQITVGIIIWVIYFFVFFRFTQGIGKSIFTLSSLFLLAIFFIYPKASFFLAVLFIVFIVTSYRVNRQIKIPYQRAQAKFEGSGIRRGLTPPEVAVILGKSFPQIITLILVGLLEKSFVIISDPQSMRFRVSNQMRTRELSLNSKKRSELRRQGAQELKQVLFPFEELFLELFEQEDGKGIREIDLGVSVKPLIKLVSERVGGHDLNCTREYYHKKIQKVSWEGDFQLSKDKIYDWGILWYLLGLWDGQIPGIEDSDYRPDWLFKSKNDSGKSYTKVPLIEWVKKLENEIKAGLSLEYLEFNHKGEFGSLSSEIMSKIIQATYHT